MIFPALSCGPKAEVFSIGILGGEAESTDQKAKVLIPIRALAEEVDITIGSATAPELSGGLSAVGDAYEFGPTGMTFERPVTITLAYQEGDIPEGVALEDLLLVTIADDGSFTVLNNIRVDTEAGTVSGDISHFSLIALTHVATESSLEVTPGELDFGDVLVTTTRTETLTITNPTADDIQITNLEIAQFAGDWSNPLAALSPAFSLPIPGALPITVAAGGERRVSVNFHPPGAGIFGADLLVSTEDATTKVPLAGRGVLSLGCLSIVPDFYDFGPVKLQPAPAVKEIAGFSLTNNSILPIQINSAQVAAFPFSTGTFSLEGASPAGSTLNSGSVTPLQASYTPETTNLEFGYILVHGTDSDGNPAGAVSLLQGHGAVGAHIRVAPLHFGPVLVGTIATLNSTIYNTGMVDFDETAYASWSWFFLPCFQRLLGPLAARDSVPAAISFCPQARGLYLASVEAAGKMGNEVIFDIAPLTGFGIDAELTFVPSPADFGGVGIGESADITVTVYNTGDFDLTVTGYDLPTAPFEVVSTVPRNLALAVGQSYIYTIRFSPTAEQQYQSAFGVTVQFTYRNLIITRTFSLPLSGSGVDLTKYKAALTVDPIEFGDVLVGTEDTKSTWITNTSDTTPDGVKIAVNNVNYVVTGAGLVFSPAFPTHVVDILLTRIQVPVTFNPPERGPFDGTIEAAGTAGGKLVTASAPVTGRGVDADLTFQPDPCDFGLVSVGDSRQIRVTVINTGDFDLTVTGYDLPNAPFEVVSTVPRTLALAVGQSYEYNIEFTPPDEGTYVDFFGITVEFEYRGETHTREFTLNLVGDGTPYIIKPWSVYISTFTADVSVYCPITPIYHLITSILVYGDDPEPMPGAQVTIKLTHPDDTTETTTLSTDANGEANITFTVNANGHYTVEIVDITGEYDERPMEYTPENNAVSSVELDVP